jgi:sugar lactone lactonase YvrE
VPTDVEVHKGMLYVSTLPGGPEDPSLGARGSVYRINPRNGDWARIGRGFLGATDVAVAPSGQVYVAELFGNKVSTIKNGRSKKVAKVMQPSAIEFAGKKLYATSDTFADTGGKIVRVKRF